MSPDTPENSLTPEGVTPSGRKRRRLRWPIRRVPRRPQWVTRLDSWLAELVVVHPNWLSAARLLVVVPLLVMGLRQVRALPTNPWLITGLFLVYVALDYLDGVAARQQRVEAERWRVLDKLTALPVLLSFCALCYDCLPVSLLGARIALEVALIALFLAGLSGRRAGRLRTGLEYATLLAMLMVSEGWAPKLLTPRMVAWLLGINVAFTTVVVLAAMKVLQKRFIADALSGANLLCGVASIRFSFDGRFDLALLFLMIGGTFDGFDGAAARRWGGTRFGVYSDDLADAINFGLAPAIAVWLLFDSWESALVGGLYLFFTWGRLVYFTLNKAFADAASFAGVPSPAAALLTMCGVVLFPDKPLLVGLIVGVAGVLMFSFDTNYRHVGRAMGNNRRIIYGMPIFLLALLLGYVLWGLQVPVTLMLLAMLVYGFLPSAMHFHAVIQRRRSERLADV
jgi:CDP-diacylglycerol--serine O-phosphatidyltransferase